MSCWVSPPRSKLQKVCFWLYIAAKIKTHKLQIDIWSSMKKIFFLLVLPVFALIACAPKGPTELTVMTHDSFAASEEIVQAFESANNVQVTFLSSGDVGAAPLAVYTRAPVAAQARVTYQHRKQQNAAPVRPGCCNPAGRLVHGGTCQNGSRLDHDAIERIPHRSASSETTSLGAIFPRLTLAPTI